MEEPDMGGPDAVAQSPYAVAKWSALAYARHLHALHKPVAYLRVFMVTGPGQLDLPKLVPYVTVSLLGGEAPKLTSGVRAVDWFYVDAVVDGYLRAAVAPEPEGPSLDIGSGERVTAGDFVLRLRDLVGGDVDPAFWGDRGSGTRTCAGGRSCGRGGCDGLASLDAARRGVAANRRL
jgi:UDP-glucose 4-epimerase